MIDALAYLNSAPQNRPVATIRQELGDFQVNEIPLITPSGSGEHLWMEIFKSNLNTQDLAVHLARALDIPVKNVSFAGLKDRRAQTTQWFSAWMPSKSDPKDLRIVDSAKVLQMVRHHKKLKRGKLQGNRFTLLLKNCSGLDDRLQTSLAKLEHSGVPNYFGEQRFGRGFGNLSRCLRFFSGTYKPRSRHERGILISSARAYLFNRYVDHRLSSNIWDVILDGDVLNLAGSQSVFVADVTDSALKSRYQEGDIHISGPLYGCGTTLAEGAAQVIEQQVAQMEKAYFVGLDSVKANYTRRAMRVIPWDVEFSVLDKKTLRLAFSLPAGAYATAVLREFFDYSVA